MVLDTGVLIAGAIPTGSATAITAITLAELEHGVAVAVRRGEGRDVVARARRLERVRAVYGEGLPFTGAVAPAYGRVVEAELAADRSPRARTADLLIAAIALHHGARLATTNRSDYASLTDLLELVDVAP